jgi:hypothetical protein
MREFWDLVLTYIKSRVSGWKSKNLYLGGRLALLKFFLSSLSFYAHSFFRYLIAIFASVQNRASSKIKTVRPSVKLDDRVILSNNIYNLIEQKGTEFV